MKNLQRTFVRDMPDRSRIVVEAKLRIDDAPLSSGFSVTAEIYEPHGTWSGRARHENGREWDCGGCMHEEVLRAFPHLAPLVTLHLCDPDGTPMYALANGWYFYSGDASKHRNNYNPTGLTDHERAAQALHIPPSDLPEGLTGDQFSAFVEGLAPRWAETARIGREVLEAE